MAKFGAQLVEKLAEIGLTESQFQQYRKMFTNNRVSRSYYIMRYNSQKQALQWSYSNHTWSLKMVAMHLKGEQIIALKPKYQYDILMIDIDNHGPQKISVKDRAISVLAAFEGRPVVYTSSQSGGIRILYFFDRAYHTSQIQKFGEAVLKAQGIELRPGFIEVRASVETDRLPFGEGSFIADHLTFEPIYGVSRADQINLAYEIYCSERLVIPAEYLVERPKNPEGRKFYITARRLLNEGLYADISTREAIWRVIYYLFKVFGLSRQKVELFAVGWLHESHNGYSDSINAGDYAKNESRICELVKQYDEARQRNKGGAFRGDAAKLSLTEVQQLIRMSKDYKTQHRIFGLLAYVKGNGIKLPSQCAAKILQGYPVSNRFFRAVAKGKSEVWICNIPSSVWRSRIGFAKSAYSKQRETLIKRKLLGVVFEGSFVAERCGCFGVRFKFDNSMPVFATLDDALFSMYSAKELRKLYNPYRAKMIKEFVEKNKVEAVSICQLPVGA